MKLRLLKPDAYQSSVWSGGNTRQIIIYPEKAVYAERDFLWRFSIATVDLPESDFTALPDYYRYSAVLKGGMRVSHASGPETELRPYVPYGFDGGIATHARGQCSDLNLMLRKGRCQGSLEALHPQAGEVTALRLANKEQVLLFAAQGGFQCEAQADIITVREGETLWLDRDSENGAQATIRDAGGSVLLIARITCQGEESV